MLVGSVSERDPHGNLAVSPTFCLYWPPAASLLSGFLFLFVLVARQSSLQHLSFLISVRQLHISKLKGRSLKIQVITSLKMEKYEGNVLVL